MPPPRRAGRRSRSARRWLARRRASRAARRAPRLRRTPEKQRCAVQEVHGDLPRSARISGWSSSSRLSEKSGRDGVGQSGLGEDRQMARSRDRSSRRRRASAGFASRATRAPGAPTPAGRCSPAGTRRAQACPPPSPVSAKAAGAPTGDPVWNIRPRYDCGVRYGRGGVLWRPLRGVRARVAASSARSAAFSASTSS